MKHRNDIDGLRALAVVPIVLFHAGFLWISGGFVGVDVFFVISGYLITKILLKEMEEGTYSVAKFYQRRILRIFPALVALLLVVSVLGYFFLFPTEFKEYGQSMYSAALFYSNIFFWRKSGYFAGASEHKALLHTWSLAVEEQFYLFFPLLLSLVAKFFKQQYRLAIAVVVVVSFALSVYWVRHNPNAAFYLLPTRVWELGLGSLVAATPLTNVGKSVRNGLSFVGLALLAYAMFALTTAMPFPGINAVYPCLGAALLIAFGEDTMVGNLLGSKPLVWIGLISYSLYLWHWPLLVFARLQYGDELSVGVAIGAILAATVAAVISYRFVEQPFRTRKFRQLSSGPILRWGVASIVGLAAMGFGINRFASALSTLPAAVKRIAAFTNYDKRDEYRFQFRPDGCFLVSNANFKQYKKNDCLTFGTDKPNYLVLGDSHAAHLWRAISEQFPNASVSQATAAGGRALIGGKGEPGSTQLKNYIFDEYLPKHRFNCVFLSGRWRAEDMPHLAETVNYISKYADKVVVLGPTIEYEGDLPVLLARGTLQKNTDLRHFLNPAQKITDTEMQKILSGTKARYFSVYSTVCPDEANKPCIQEAPNGDPMEFDYGHFTLAGSRFVAKKLHDAFPDLG